MKGPPLAPAGEDITRPDQVAPRGRKASSTRKIKPQTSTLILPEALTGNEPPPAGQTVASILYSKQCIIPTWHFEPFG